jgi:hypothetical protein
MDRQGNARRYGLIPRLPANPIPPAMTAGLDEIYNQLNQARLQIAR